VSDLDSGLTADPLFVGATRPPMRWGVTYSALLFNMVFTLETFLLTKNLLTLLLCAPIHGVCMLLCARDARFFDLLLLWGRTRLPALFANLRVWKASSYSPLSLDLPNRRGRRDRSATVEQISPAGLIICHRDGIGNRGDETSGIKT
jgi:type IV secretion system protein VirB3